MKKIEAIVRPEKVSAVRRALEKTGYTGGVTVTDVEGQGKQKGKVQQFRGEEYKTELLPKVKLEFIVKDADMKGITRAIIDAAKTGEIGDGKIFIYDVADAIQIRTEKSGDAAI